MVGLNKQCWQSFWNAKVLKKWYSCFLWYTNPLLMDPRSSGIRPCLLDEPSLGLGNTGRGWASETQRQRKGWWACWGYFLTDGEGFLETETWTSDGILRIQLPPARIYSILCLEALCSPVTGTGSLWEHHGTIMNHSQTRLSQTHGINPTQPPQLQLPLDQESRAGQLRSLVCSHERHAGIFQILVCTMFLFLLKQC